MLGKPELSIKTQAAFGKGRKYRPGYAIAGDGS